MHTVELFIFRCSKFRSVSALSLFGITVVLSGCTAFVRTQPPVNADVKPVPAERVLAYATEAPGTGRVVITRDSGVMGGGCYLAVLNGATLVARLDTAERVVLFLPIGQQPLAAAPDPMGRGLCGINGFTPVVEMHTVSASETRLRLSLGAYRRPRIVLDKP